MRKKLLEYAGLALDLAKGDSKDEHLLAKMLKIEAEFKLSPREMVEKAFEEVLKDPNLQ